MHEMGIVLHLAKTLDETAEENHLRAIGKVVLQVGEVSGIVTSFMSAPLGGVFMLGMFTKRANTAGTLVGVVCGVAVAVACWALNKSGTFGINFMWFSVFSLLATCVAGYLASLLFAAISHHAQKEN